MRTIDDSTHLNAALDNSRLTTMAGLRSGHVRTSPRINLRSCATDSVSVAFILFTTTTRPGAHSACSPAQAIKIRSVARKLIMVALLSGLNCSESKSNLPIQTVSRQLTALVKMIELQFKGSVVGKIEPHPNRRAVIS